VASRSSKSVDSSNIGVANVEQSISGGIKNINKESFNKFRM